MEKNVKITTGRSLAKTLEVIMKESIKQTLYQNSVDEKEKQEKFLGEEDELLDDDKSEEEKSSKTVDDEKNKLKKGDITTDDIVQKLNVIRSGKSFKDESISSKMSEYIESLSRAERTALFAFLKGLSQIVTGEISPEDAVDPSDPPAVVNMKKGSEKKTKSIKPNVIRKNSETKEKSEKKKPSSEDTSGPVPIVAKNK